MSEISKYCSKICQLVNDNDGYSLSKQLSLPTSKFNFTQENNILYDSSKYLNCLSYCLSNLPENIGPLVGNRLQAFMSIASNDFITAYRYVQGEYNAALEFFSNKDDEDTAWFIPVMVKISNDLRVIASLADRSAGDSENTYLRESLQNLTRGWTVVAKDRTPITSPNSKKFGLLALTNVLFKVYFSLNTLSLCGKLINVVEGPASGGILTKIHLFPVNDVVMYKYYLGRLKMFEDKYEEASACLQFALRFTPKSNFKNRQRILATLVPIQMCLGIMPGDIICQKYQFEEFAKLGEAAKCGDIQTFDKILSQNQITFIRVGIFLVLEQAKHIVYRNLLKRIYHITNSTRLNLIVLQTIFQSLDHNDDLDEIECILANQIFQGKIKGYLSHQKRFLVLSKADPFPRSAVIKGEK